MWWGDEDGGSSSGAWNGDILARLGDSTDVTIDVEAFRGGLDLDVRSNICIEPTGTGRSMRVYFVQVLDHFPASPSYSRNAFRQVFTQDVTIAAGACVEVEKLMALKDADALQPEDIGIVVFAQEPLSGGPAEIYQTAFLFDPPGIKADGFENGDISAWE